MELLPDVKRLVDDIKSLRVQGARNVAKAAIKAIALQLKGKAYSSTEDLLKDMAEMRNLLVSLRPTEPMTRNLLEALSRDVISRASFGPEKLLSFLDREVEEILDSLDKRFNDMLEVGSNHITEGSTIITICHSSSVVGILKRAKDKGKQFKVISCETRPRYQGRITAKELSAYGIDVVQIVDSAASSFIRKADLSLVGADAVTAEGNLYNKIGTNMLAILSNKYSVPFYSAAELFKFDPKTMMGYIEPVEYRDPSEVWADPPRGVKVLNPAFDKTSSKLISGYITEVGILPPHRFGEEFEEMYRE